LKRQHKASPAANTNTPENTPKFKVKYKPGSILSGIKKKPPKAAHRDDSLDPEIQKAIALSMNESNAASATSINTSQQQENGGEPVIRSEVVFGDDELEMVMAMSLSEAEFQQKSNKLSEEEAFQRALEESRRSTSTPAVASLPIKDEFSDLLGSSHSSSSEDFRRKRRSTNDKVVSANSNESSMDTKIPAKPTKSDSSNQGKSDLAAAGTSRDSRSDRKVEALSRDSQSRSSRRSTANKTGRNDSSLSNLKESAKSTEDVSSNNNTKSSLTDQRVKERPPSQDSCDSKPSTASFSSAGRYGKSLRPSSNKNLSITRTSSGSSRSSLSAAREQASAKNVVDDSTSKAFSPYTDSVELSPAKGITVQEYANARSQRSLFATSNKTKGLTR